MKAKKFRAEWLILCLVGVVTFISFAYMDLLSTQRHGICFWDSLFSGNILNYYKDCELVHTGNTYYHVDMSAHYDMTLYFIFAIWNLPCYIYEKITGLNAQELTVFILWGKALVLAAYLLVIREIVLIRKILDPDGGKEDLHKVAIAAASSALLLIYSIGTGNYDVISLIFMLSGTRMFMCGRRKAAILHFALAFSMKYFAVWCFIPILLLYEKKILKLCQAMIGLVSISLVEKIIFMSSVYLHREDTVAGNILNGMMGTLLGSSLIKIPGIGAVSLLIPAYLACLLFAYFRKVEEGHKNSEAVRYGFLSWGIFFLLADYSQYWIVFLIPFMVLALADVMPIWRERHPKLAGLPWILESMAALLILIRGAIGYEWVFLTDSGTYLLPYGLAKLFNREPVWGHSFGGTLKHLNADHPFLPVVNVLIFVILTALMLLCFLAAGKKDKDRKAEKREWIGSVGLRLRTIFQLTLALIPLAYYLLMMFTMNENGSGEEDMPKQIEVQNEVQEVVGAFNIDPGTTYQTWEGFGTSSCWWSQYVGGWDEAAGDIDIPVREQIAKWLYDPEEGIGLTIYRYNVGAGSADSGKGDISDKNRRAQSFLTEDGSYNWEKDENAVWFMNRCVELGAEDVVFFCNSPIEQVTTNGKALMDEGSTSNLEPENYQAFADYVFDVAEHFREEGIPVTMISPINEPQWEWTSGQEGCHYTPEAVRDVLKVFLSELHNRELEDKVTLTAPESGEWGGDATKAYVDAILQDEELGAYFTAMDIHSYWSDKIKKQLFMQWKDSHYPDLQLVMSEWCEMVNGVDYTMDSAFNMADTIYEDMTICNVLSWQYWVGVADGDYRDGLIYVDKSTKTAKPNRRLWEFGNYARYIKPGYTRVDITTEDDDLKLLKPVAFTGTDENGKEVLVIVLINRGDVQKFSLQGLSGNYTSYDIHTTTDRMDLEETASGSLEDLNAQVFEIEGRSISTVVLRK